MEIVQIATYIFGLVFAIGFMGKAIQYARMPIHLRWELYPLAGERNRPWGGSYLEKAEWWTTPPERKSLAGELAFMGQEVFLFREYFQRNRRLWTIVYPFHIAIFLFILFFMLLIVGALVLSAEIAVAGEGAGAGGEFLYYATLVAGVGAFTLGTTACTGLFLHKLTDPTMRTYARRIELFNILLVLAIFLTGLCSWALADATFTDAREFVRSLFSYKEMARIEAVSIAHILLLGAFLAYLPFTNMMHFFAKFFTYHKVRWDDAPHLRGSYVERRIEPLLEQTVTWSAPHIEGIKQWRDIASQTNEPPRKE